MVHIRVLSQHTAEDRRHHVIPLEPFADDSRSWLRTRLPNVPSAQSAGKSIQHDRVPARPKKRGRKDSESYLAAASRWGPGRAEKLKPEAAVQKVWHGTPTPQAVGKKLKPEAAVQKVGLGTPTPQAA